MTRRTLLKTISAILPIHRLQQCEIGSLKIVEETAPRQGVTGYRMASSMDRREIWFGPPLAERYGITKGYRQARFTMTESEFSEILEKYERGDL